VEFPTKRANSTHYHYGVMAIWQMRAVYHNPNAAHRPPKVLAWSTDSLHV